MALPNPLPSEAVGPPGVPGVSKGLDKIWTVTGVWDLAEKTVSQVVSQLPAFTHSITVAVQGGPEADIRRIYYLALSAAFGRYRNKVRSRTQSGQIQTTWDITGKACTVEISYATGRLEDAVSDNPALGAGLAVGIGIASTLATGNIIAGIAIGTAVYLAGTATVQLSRVASAGPADPTRSAQDIFRRGPEQLTIGGNFADILDSKRFLTSNVSQESNPTWAIFKSCQFTVTRNNVPFTTLRRQGPLREWPVGNDRNATVYPYAINAIRTLANGLISAGGGSAPAGVNVGSNNGAFNLPDHGRIITTADKTTVTIQSPAPPVDGQTRGGLLALVAQALQKPCFLPPSPPCTDTPLGGVGVWVAPIGSDDSYEAISNKVQGARGTVDPSKTDPGRDTLNNAIDGYDAAPAFDPTNFESR